MGQCCSDFGEGQPLGGVGKNSQVARSEADDAIAALTGTRSAASHVELSLSGSNFRNRDLLSKSDPMVVAYSKGKDGSLSEIGRTEVVPNTLNPVWVTKFKVVYNFEEIQELVFRVFDIDVQFGDIAPEKLQLPEQQFLGEMECLLAEILRSPSFSRTLQERKELMGNGALVQEFGSLSIRAEEMFSSKLQVEIHAHCSELVNKDVLSKSDPFLQISRRNQDGTRTLVYKTEVKRNNLNPAWKPILVNLQQLCNGDRDRLLLWECFDYESDGKHKLLGGTELSLNQVVSCAESRIPTECVRPGNGHGPAKAGGKLHFETCTITPIHTFLDYVTGGCEVSFMVAVDFTASNGSPLQHDSLHYMDPHGRPNAYQKAIKDVGEVIEFYDTDKKFLAWGFGGRPIDEPVSHCFSLNGNQTNAEVHGVKGILHSYSQALLHVALAGPTLFAPVINMAASLASKEIPEGNQKYFVLLIITDGVITDMHQTTTALVHSSQLPLSVIIIGVGGADFTDMETLDADKRRLTTAEGKVAVRDIVQFVPLQAVRKDESLAKLVLAELPFQLLEYMKSKQILPKSAGVADNQY